ncbi:MAG: metallophosphoesterase [Actinomycetes bacterium]
MLGHQVGGVVVTVGPASHAPAGPRLAVIGDVSGHLGPFVEQLIVLGVDVDTAAIPDGLIVCQVGDLVHKGVDGDDIVELVDRLMTAHPGRWVQLMGNHEAQYLPGRTRFWSQSLRLETITTLRRWWSDGRMTVAGAFDIAAGIGPVGAVDDCLPGGLLVTHAGLTAGAWRLLGHPATVRQAAEVLNSRQAPVVWRTGAVMTGIDDLCAGPLWAAAGSELVGSWAVLDERVSGTRVPRFAQAHGHTAAVPWPAGTAWSPPKPRQPSPPPSPGKRWSSPTTI